MHIRVSKNRVSLQLKSPSSQQARVTALSTSKSGVESCHSKPWGSIYNHQANQKHNSGNKEKSCYAGWMI